MKTTLLAAAAAFALSTAPAFAQSAITTQTPPNPNAQSYTPQSSVSLPASAATAVVPRAGDEIGTTPTAPVAGRTSRAVAAAR